MKITEIRALSDEQLQSKLAELKKDFFNLRFQHATNQLDNPQKLKAVKHDIARVMTVIRQREIGARS